MLKIICTFMALIITLAILCSNNVESRVAYGNLGVIPASQLRYPSFGNVLSNGENSNEVEDRPYIHAKRKSELLSSLYGLPYGLVNKRNAN